MRPLGLLLLVGVAGLLAATGSVRRARRRSEGQLELAVSRLRVLASLDGQLRAFAEEQQQVAGACWLNLTGPVPAEPDCLGERRLAERVPPYMLNLRRKLLGQPVPLMPYRSQVMRSLSQQAANLSSADEPELLVELSAFQFARAGRPPAPRPPAAPARVWASCLPAERRRPLSERAHLCYRFPLPEAVGAQIGAGKPERLLEAELHLFKLPAARLQAKRLKTNLLEVSLFQVMAGEEEPAPLRLLDIRRIDLHASGWETFYVKRALDDWLADAASNLGLVIKAKSMLEEPIPLGQIRFADRYEPSVAPSFARAHQPILVIYTAGRP